MYWLLCQQLSCIVDFQVVYVTIKTMVIDDIMHTLIVDGNCFWSMAVIRQSQFATTGHNELQNNSKNV